jgi:hypothetical protein
VRLGPLAEQTVAHVRILHGLLQPGLSLATIAAGGFARPNAPNQLRLLSAGHSIPPSPGRSRTWWRNLQDLQSDTVLLS